MESVTPGMEEYFKKFSTRPESPKANINYRSTKMVMARSTLLNFVHA